MELHSLFERFRTRAQTDEAFRAQLQNDPEGVLLQETGMSAAQLMEAFRGSLSEEALQGVVGGSGDGRLGGRLQCPICGYTAWDIYEMTRHAGQCRG